MSLSVASSAQNLCFPQGKAFSQHLRCSSLHVCPGRVHSLAAPSAWVWKSPWHFHTSFQHRLEMACSPLIYILHTTPKLLVVVMGWCSMVWVSHRFPLWRSPCEIWGVEGHLRWGGWILFSTPQMECVGTASLSLCASGAAINNRSNQHLSFSGLLKAGVNLNSLYHENSWGRDFLPNSVPASLTFQSSGLSGLRRKTVSCACCALGSVFVWLKYSVT